MSRKAFAAMPRVLLMRELRVRVEKRGFRTKDIVVVTTLLDAEAYPRDELAALYRDRWNAELDIRSIKQTLRMDVLRCKTPDLVRKEIWAHLLVYNLIRGAMAEAARRHKVMPRRLSLQRARQTFQAFRDELNRVPAKVASAERSGARSGRVSSCWSPARSCGATSHQAPTQSLSTNASAA